MHRWEATSLTTCVKPDQLLCAPWVGRGKSLYGSHSVPRGLRGQGCQAEKWLKGLKPPVKWERKKWDKYLPGRLRCGWHPYWFQNPLFWADKCVKLKMRKEEKLYALKMVRQIEDCVPKQGIGHREATRQRKFWTPFKLAALLWGCTLPAGGQFWYFIKCLTFIFSV